tara:strand:+ start:1736 stop:2998 length:1263 start_codon:yes stop_codon:yes gene_type:complete
MKKVLIVSYFSKPSNFVGAERVQGWLNYLPENNIYPILITRFWKENQKDISLSEGLVNDTVEEKKNYEIHRVTRKKQLRDYLIEQNKWILIRKILSLKQLILNNIWFKKSEYYHFFVYIDELIRKEKNLDTLIVSGTPFHSFIIGYNIKKKWPKLKWYPDYRDHWNTHPFKSKSGIINGLLFQLERRNEKKWTSNAKAFITVSENWRDRIFEFIKKPGYVVKNGYDLDILAIQEQTVPRNKNKLVISYIGTIYPYQNYKLFLEVIGELILENSFNIELNFIGIDSFYKISPDIKKRTMKFSKCVNIIERIPKNELKAIYKKSDLLWLTSFGKMKGWYPVKLFEYASQGIPILLYPTDNDDMEEFIKTTSSGFVFIEKEELKKWLVSIFNSESSIKINLNKGNLAKYSRRFQTSELAKIIK